MMDQPHEPQITADGVAYLRTPEAAFAGLTDFPYGPNYASFQGLRMHYVDEGPRDGPVALLMHGMPTWSYLNRHLIRRLTAAGYRCVAADHIGFGRSDKVIDDSWYAIDRHVQAHRALIEGLPSATAPITPLRASRAARGWRARPRRCPRRPGPASPRGPAHSGRGRS